MEAQRKQIWDHEKGRADLAAQVEKLQGDAEFMEGELNSLRGTVMQQGQQVRAPGWGLTLGALGRGEAQQVAGRTYEQHEGATFEGSDRALTQQQLAQVAQEVPAMATTGSCRHVHNVQQPLLCLVLVASAAAITLISTLALFSNCHCCNVSLPLLRSTDCNSARAAGHTYQ